MKKNLLVLTGIALLIAVLAAVGCNRGAKKASPTSEEPVPKAAVYNSTEVTVYLKDTTMANGEVHLQMWNEKDSLKKVVDSLYTDVYPGYTVIFKKAHKSNVSQVDTIRLVVPEERVFSVNESEVKGLYRIDIDTSAVFDTVKYEIIFTVKKDSTRWLVDPYLRIPPTVGP